VADYHLRVYEANGNLGAALGSGVFREKYGFSGEIPKGHASIRVPGFKNGVQLLPATNRVVIHGAAVNDEKILTTLRNDMPTRDGHPFSWTLRKTRIWGKSELTDSIADLLEISRLRREQLDGIVSSFTRGKLPAMNLPTLVRMVNEAADVDMVDLPDKYLRRKATERVRGYFSLLAAGSGSAEVEKQLLEDLKKLAAKYPQIISVGWSSSNTESWQVRPKRPSA
jgi:hypothetical protein